METRNTLFSGKNAVKAFIYGLLVLLLANICHANSIESEIVQLLESHPGLTSQRQKIAASKANQKATDAAFLPVISLNGSAGRENIYPATIANPTRLNQKTASLSISQNLFSGYSFEAQSEIAESETSIETINLEKITQDLLLSGTRAYLNVLRQNYLLMLSKDNENNIANLLEIEKQRRLYGASLVADVLQAEIRLKFAKERRSFYQNNFDSAVAAYIGIFNHPPSIDEMLNIETPDKSLPDNIQLALETTGKNNVNLKNFNYELDKARSNIRFEKSGTLPSINLVGSADWQDDADGTEGIRKENSVIVQFKWNLYDGKKTSSRVDSANKQLQALNDDYAQLLRRTEESVRISWDKYKNGKERLTYLSDAESIAAELYDNRQQLRAAGQNTAQEVLDARNEYFSSQISKVSAEFDTKIAAFELLHSMGTLKGNELRSIVPNQAAKKTQPSPDTNTEMEIADHSLSRAPQNHLLDKPEDNYVLQILAVRNDKSMKQFIDVNNIAASASSYTVEHKGRDMHILVYGDYPDISSAINSIAELPDNIRSLKPWPRQISMVQQEIRTGKK